MTLLADDIDARGTDATPTSFGLLGPLRIEDRTGPVPLAAIKQRTVLAVLLLAEGRPVSIRQFQQRLWDVRPPPTAVAALRNYVSALRRALCRVDGLTLSTVDDSYLLDLPSGAVDSRRFAMLLRRGDGRMDAGDAAGAAEAYGAALRLWRGPVLADLLPHVQDWPERAELEERRLVAEERRIAAELALGRHLVLVPELERLTREHPLRESLCRLHMLALAHSGRQAHALQAYFDVRHRLKQSAGRPPGTELEAAYRAVLEGCDDVRRTGPVTSSRAGDVLTLLIDGAVAGPPGGRTAPVGPPGPADPGPGAPIRPWWTASVVEVDREPTSRPAVLGISLQLAEAGRAPADADLDSGIRSVTRAVHRHHGQVEQIVGAQVVASFGAFRSEEDGPERAVRAALALQSPAGVGVGLRYACAVSAGPGARPDRPATPLLGSLVDDCIALLESPGPGRVRVTPAAARATERAIAYDTAAGSGPVRAVGLRPPEVCIAAARPAPHPGHAVELALLSACLDRAVRQARPCLVTVTGPAGTGKSRLVADFIDRLGAEHRGVSPVRVPDLRYRSPAGLPAPTPPGRAGPVLDAVLALLAPPGPAAGRPRFRAALRAAGPVVLIFDRLHGQDDDVVDLAEALVRSVPAHPLLVLVTARPHLHERRPRWSAPAGTDAVTLVLRAPA